jgi:hypothetical protein
MDKNEKNQKMAEAQAELDAARAWMDQIPLDATPEQIAHFQIVAQFWPERIMRLARS